MINTEKHLCYVLKTSPDELGSICNNINSYYREFPLIKEKDGKIKSRVINPSIKRLKTIQRSITKNILNKIDFPSYAYGAIKNRSNIENAKKHQGKKYIFTTDLKDFFPLVGHTMVFKTLRGLGFAPTTSRILTKLTTHKGRLPQGAPTSPLIANLVFDHYAGSRMRQLASENDLTFTSFIDDLTFSSSTDFKDKTPVIIAAIKNAGFKISHSKTNYKTKNPTVTGIVVKNNYLTVPHKIKSKLTNPSSSDKAKDALRTYIQRVDAA